MESNPTPTVAATDTRTLPPPRGDLSEAVTAALSKPAHSVALPSVGDAEPLGADVQLALLMCYELHYRGFVGVDGGWEWNPHLLRFRAELERAFLDALRDRVAGREDAETLLDELTAERPDDYGVSHHLHDSGSWAQMREYFVHRSIYQLKEADPYVWAIPRLQGQAKASLVAVEFDEFGAGHGSRVHSGLYADLMEAADLDAGYLAYLEAVPAQTLAVANLATLFGLHRSLRGALIGHFAVTEASTGPAAKRLVDALTAMAAPSPCVHFYAEHIEADAVHEQVVRHDIIRPLLASEPDLEPSVAFGMEAVAQLEGDLADYVMERWRKDQVSLSPGV